MSASLAPGAEILRAEITPTDRLSMTLCLALILHGVIVLGITFAPEEEPQPRYESMEIVLVQEQSRSDDEAKLLAQATLEGGGEASEELNPAVPTPPPFPDDQPDAAAPPPGEAQPEPAAAETQQQIQQQTQEQLQPEATPQQLEQLIVENAEAKQATAEAVEEEKPEVQQEQTSRPEQRRRPSATALLTNSFKIAALSAEIKQKLQTKAERPKRTFISATTREYKYAAYMEAWRAKVERVGNLNYPEEARRRRINGSLILDVALEPDGSVSQIVIRRSSGHKLLDDAAVRIVRLAAPFAPFPAAIKQDTDILHITRTWQFLNNRGFR